MIGAGRRLGVPFGGLVGRLRGGVDVDGRNEERYEDFCHGYLTIISFFSDSWLRIGKGVKTWAGHNNHEGIFSKSCPCMSF